MLFIWLFNEVQDAKVPVPVKHVSPTFNMQAVEMAEEINVQISAPTESSQRPKRIVLLFLSCSRQSKRTCTCCQAQSWQNRMAVVSRRKQTVSFLAITLYVVICKCYYCSCVSH